MNESVIRRRCIISNVSIDTVFYRCSVYFSIRDIALISAIYLTVLAGYTLIAQVRQGNNTLSYMEFIKNQNYRSMTENYNSLSAFLHQAYVQRTSGAGGLLGMLIAYPLWQVLGLVGGALFAGVILIALIFILFRMNPAELFRTVSDHGEARRMQRAEKRREKEAARAQQEANQPMEQPPVQEYPMENIRRGQSVVREESVYTPPPSYYQPAPIYDTHPATQNVPPKQEQNFYAVAPDLYDEHIPVNARKSPGR